MGARSLRIDTLRGIAVFGILLVNVWSFVYGGETPRYGVFDAAASGADHAAVFFAAAFAEQKFYPIFAFLFGAGFALQTGRARAAGPALAEIRLRYGRRITWLLGCGLVHGLLLWYGDILTTYALTAFWLAPKAGRRLAALKDSLHNVLVVNVLVQVVMAAFIWMASRMDESDVDAMLLAGQEAFATYTQGGWLEIAGARVADFSYNLFGGALFFPRIALLFLIGVFAVRLGWLTRPERHAPFWRKVLVVGLGIGLPLNLWWGYVALHESIDPYALPAGSWLALYLIDLAGPCLAAGYVAALMLARGAVLRAMAAVFAPVGRMALTNYLLQTLLCSVLLQGVGLGLGALLTHAQLFGLCGALMLVQVGFSRWWLAQRTQGPVEALWRSYTY